MNEKLKKSKLIVSLIKDDLINTKLVNGLEALGLDAINYHLHLSETVFELFGFPDDQSTENIFEYYLAELKKAKQFSIRGTRDKFDALALSIYTELQRRANEKR